MALPLVSVVVPTFNRARVVGRTIESALAQTHEAIEVVVVDDGSTDDTKAAIEKSYGGDARVRYVHKTNGGPASARNVGFEHARGEYVALLDSDDTWHPWKLALQIQCMERDPDLGMTWTDMEMIDPSGAVVDPAYLRTMYHAYRGVTNEQLFSRSTPLREIAPELADVVGDAPLRTGNLFSRMILGNHVHTSTVVLRRERLAKVRGFDETLRYSGEDYDFHLRTCREGTVGLLDLPAIRYQQGMPDRLTANRYAVHMAENALRTVERAIARDRGAIDLPDEVIRHRLAKAHAWVAREHLERGEVDEARTHLRASLREERWQPELAREIILAALPFGAGVNLRRQLRAVRSRFRGDAHA
jgi:glycosyltransferase involved in cell wall biosynthesis